MNNLFLLNESLIASTPAEIESGIENLNEIRLLKENGIDSFLKHESIWMFNIGICTVQELFYSVINKETQRIVPLLFESFKSYGNYIPDENSFTNYFPNDFNAFAGYNFSQLQISNTKQIVNSQSFLLFKRTSLLNTKATSCQHQRIISTFLFPNYNFDDEAIEDIFYWNTENPLLYSRLNNLLADIQSNPFTGGIGKTEVLKNKNGMASKRLDDENRLTYSLKNEIIKVFRCKGHYS